MNTTISIISAGSMGAAIAGVFSRCGIRVFTTIAGRSKETALRAAAAGMEVVSAHEIVKSDFLLSILPPSAALACASHWAPLLSGAVAKPLYVDCNAISPRTARDIGAILTDCGTPFVDAGIIGLPPRDGMAGPRIYASGDHASRFAVLGRYGLDIRVLDGPIGAASGLKLCFAGINKGLTAMAAAMILAAARADAQHGLRQEIEENWPSLWGLINRRVLDMPSKAHRWVGEMREIAEFAAEDAATRAIFHALSDLFDRLAQDAAGSGAEIAALREFFR